MVSKIFSRKSPDEIFFREKMQKFAKFHPLTPTFGGSIPGGWAGVFRHKTLEKRKKCSCDSVTCSKPSAQRENVGVWGHSPQEKFAVSNVCGVLCRSRSVWSRRCDCMVCVVVVGRVCPHAVRPLYVAAASDPPTRTIGSSRRVFWTPSARPRGVA